MEKKKGDETPISPFLDIKSENIVYLLSQDSRRPISGIARQLGQSRRKTELRYKRLFDEGFLTHYTVINQPPQFRASVFLKLKYVDDRLIEKLKEIPEVVLVTRTLSFYSLFCLLLVPSKEVMDEVVLKISIMIHGTTKRMDVLPHEWTGPLGYKAFCHKESLLKKNRVRPVDRELTKTEARTLEALRPDPMIPYTELCQKAGVTYRTLGKAIRSLKRDGFLRFTIFMNYPRMGLQYGYMLLQMEPDERKRFEEYCLNHPNIHWLKFGRGMWDYVLSIVSRNNNQFIDITDQIQKDFVDGMLESTSLIRKLAMDWSTLRT